VNQVVAKPPWAEPCWGLIKPTGGTITYDGTDLQAISAPEMKKMRRHIQIVFQDPYSSLNPKLTIGSAIAEPLLVHNILPGKQQRTEKVMELLEKVNLKPEHFHRYPHEFSGGQRQRIVIARALALILPLLFVMNPYRRWM
jgi:peptide/nickel transport system ATP-binding protein